MIMQKFKFGDRVEVFHREQWKDAVYIQVSSQGYWHEAGLISKEQAIISPFFDDTIRSKATVSRENFEVVTAPHQSRGMPVLFLAGPIQGAPNWQQDAIAYIEDAAHLCRTNFLIANPRRPIANMGEFSREMYAEQVAWEHHHLSLAATPGRGVILFWLANEATHVERRAYAQTTRLELGEALALHYCRGASVVVGIDSEFTGRSYIHETFPVKAPGIPLLASLKETCQAAVEILNRQRG